MQHLYLWIDLFTLLGPLALSFDKKVAFYKNWKRLFISTLLMMLVFIPWDIAFTVNGIWGFNPDYLSGWTLFHLPIEEWLFFIVVPYATVFIYECCKSYFNLTFQNAAKFILMAITILLVFVGALFYDHWYTMLNFIGAAVVIVITLIVDQKHLSYLLIGYVLSLIPFLIVNGVLTGSMIEEPIVWYNDMENMGLRIFTIPIEDSIYFLFFFMLVLIPYEKLRHAS